MGAFAASPGPYGTFDQGGDVWQWNEANMSGDRGVRGGDWSWGPDCLAASAREGYYPTGEGGGIYVGFRVAIVPEPGSIVLAVVGGLCLLGYAWRRRA